MYTRTLYLIPGIVYLVWVLTLRVHLLWKLERWYDLVPPDS